ncbi:MAG: hypothetical protein BWK73_44255 [Thiothrix lacustris]|uniref:site-specific DNA-methyltransferase (adenine-specific) n=1 Tax=Thiothrix lacustris TaxID=525917 RepID=A0A1Y1QBF5_9GAMM|nr:MAG: hypothetical protein BWK73_44255 [Thiothrix lacustris]
MKPFLEGKDLKQWRAESRNLYLILFPKGWTREQIGSEIEPIDETTAWNWLKQQHPAICQTLEPFAVAGRKRTDKGDFWWEMRTCAYYDKYEEDKIIFAHFQDAPLYFFDRKRIYTNNRGYIFPNAGFFELGLLTSKVMWMVFTGMTSSIRGGFYEATTQNTNRFPIPDATDEQKTAIATLAENCQALAEQRYTLENAFRRRIPDLCPKDRDPKLSQKLQAWWLLDFSAFRDEVKKLFKQDIPFDDVDKWSGRFDKDKAVLQDLSYQLAVQEQALNRAVYALFGLDAAEIALLEATI